ncbi:MAG: hypothetical protein VX223_03615, partial [Myxococcota bacterium]|nr:hypothetical protein [Myxococcota bacterium]
MSMTLSFLDDNERLKRVGEPSPDELLRQERAREMARGLGADTAAPATALMNQGAKLGLGLAMMLQQGAGNKAVAGLLVGTSIAAMRNGQARGESGPKRPEAASKPGKPAEAPAAAPDKVPSERPQQTESDTEKGEPGKKPSKGLLDPVNKAFQFGTNALNKGVGNPLRAGGNTANAALRSGLGAMQQPVDRAAEKTAGVGNRLRSWGDRQNNTLAAKTDRANASMQQPTQRMSGFAANLRSYGDRANARYDQAAMRANRTLERPTSRFQSFGASLRSWGDRQNAKYAKATQRANAALERPAQGGAAVGQALRQFGDKANAKVGQVGEGLVNRYFDRGVEQEFWKGQKRRQLGNKLNRTLLGDDYNSAGMRQLPDRLDGRKWDGIPSALANLVSESQRNLPPQVVGHLSGFLAKVTPEMESQMSPGEKERLEQLRELVRKNEERAEQDAAADAEGQGGDSAEAAPRSGTERTPRIQQPNRVPPMEQQASTPEAESLVARPPEQIASPQQTGMVRAGADEQGQLEGAASQQSKEPTAAEVGVSDGPLIELEPTGQDDEVRPNGKEVAAQRLADSTPLADQRTRRSQEAAVAEAQACANAAVRPPADSTAELGGLKLNPEELRNQVEVQVAQQGVPSGATIDTNATPRTLTELGEAERGETVRRRGSGMRVNRSGHEPVPIGDATPEVRDQPSLPTVEQRGKRAMDGVNMPAVAVNLPGNRALEGQSQESEMGPDGQPKKTQAQIDAESRMVGDEAKRQLDAKERDLQREAQAEADTRQSAAEAERDAAEAVARTDGDARIASQEQHGQQQRAAAEAEGQQRRAAAEREQQRKQATADTEGQRREAEAATARAVQESAERVREQQETAAAEAERARQEQELRCQVQEAERAAQTDSEARQAAARAQGQADEAQLERDGEVDKARLRENARTDAARLEQQGRRDAQRREQEGQTAQRREEQRGRQRQRRLQAEARRKKSSQGWLSRAASWVSSQFNSLMNRARAAFNAAVQA